MNIFSKHRNLGKKIRGKIETFIKKDLGLKINETNVFINTVFWKINFNNIVFCITTNLKAPNNYSFSSEKQDGTLIFHYLGNSICELKAIMKSVFEYYEKKDVEQNENNVKE